MAKWLLVGLGNPGPEYRLTRHNVGFWVVDELARRWGIALSRKQFNGKIGSGSIGMESVTLLEPQTFMNLSGRSVGPALGFLQIPPDHLIVIHDEIDLPLARLRIKQGGGHGGHNGLRSIHQCIGTSEYLRIRVGVGRPEHGDVTNHVLGRFGDGEQPDVLAGVDKAADAVELLLKDGLSCAMNAHNGQEPSPAKVGATRTRGERGSRGSDPEENPR